jgi:hypothetical protein
MLQFGHCQSAIAPFCQPVSESMNDSSEQIQSSLGATSASLSIPPAEALAAPRSRTRVAGGLFGAFVGAPIGMLTAAVVCWIADEGDYWQIAQYGAIIGPLPGAAIGYVERTWRGDLAIANVATFIGPIFGLLPAALIFFFSSTAPSVRLVAGVICAGPMAGLIIGAIFDRAFEESTQKSWLAAIGFAAFGIGLCISGVLLIHRYGGADPLDVAHDTRPLILDQWANDPDLRRAKIVRIELTRKDLRTFSGFFEASLDGRPATFDIEVEVNRGIIQAKWLLRQ